jgi:hypothetical protein
MFTLERAFWRLPPLVRILDGEADERVDVVEKFFDDR